MNSLVKKDLVRGLPSLEFTHAGLCEACVKGKAKRASHKGTTASSITEPMQLMHMDLFGRVNVMSLARKRYALVIVDDYSKYTLVFFLFSKDETPQLIIDFIKQVERDLKDNLKFRAIRSDNGTEFRNSTMNGFCTEQRITRQFSAPRTLQQNGVLERKNRTLTEAAKTMLSVSKLPIYFWEEAVRTTCYTQNRTLINKKHMKTPYILTRRKPLVKYFHVYGTKCFILNDEDDRLGKFAEKVHEAIFVGYTPSSYRVFLIKELVVKESVNVTFLPQVFKPNDLLSH